MKNQENTQAQAMTLTEAVTTMASAIQELVALAKEEATSTTSTTEATTATTETTTADAEFKGSMINNDPCDPIPAIGENQVFVKELDKIADEANAVADTEKMLDDIIADISALYNISSYALSNEGKNIESDRSPYAPKENKMGVIGDYQVFISKEITKDGDHIEGSFRLIIKDRSIVTPIMDLNIHLIDSCAKVFSSENTCRVEKMKEDHDLMRFLNIVEEISSVVTSKYIDK